jgi:hypothetical protein
VTWGISLLARIYADTQLCHERVRWTQDSPDGATAERVTRPTAFQVLDTVSPSITCRPRGTLMSGPYVLFDDACMLNQLVCIDVGTMSNPVGSDDAADEHRRDNCRKDADDRNCDVVVE